VSLTLFVDGLVGYHKFWRIQNTRKVSDTILLLLFNFI